MATNLTHKVAVLVLTVCLVATHCVALEFQAANLNTIDVKFLSSTTFNTAGYLPSICGLNNTIVIVYDTNIPSESTLNDLPHGSDSAYHDDANPNLRYSIFTTEPNGKINQVGGDTYAEGYNPFITAHPSSNMVIAVRNDDNSNSLFYHVGQLTGTTIKWITPQAGILYVQEGTVASISVNNNGTVVTTHQISNEEPGALYYCVGNLNTSLGIINWYNSSHNGLCSPQIFTTKYGWTPKGQVTNDGRVLVTFRVEGDGLFYIIGKLKPDTTAGNNSIAIDWVTKEMKYTTCIYNNSLSCSDGAVMVDPFGTVMEVHYANLDHQVQYKMGVLHDNYIQWKDNVVYDSGYRPAVTFLNGTEYFYGEIHILENNILQISIITAFDVELVSITYGKAVPSEKVLFDTDSSEFENNGPATLGETWNIKSEVSCTNTHSWSTSLHAGISVTAKVNFFFASASATAEESIGFTIGKSYSSTKTFTWEEDEKITVPANVGKVSYSAALYRVPHTIPFVAIFKRGPFTWQETGSVYVTHGGIFTNIYAYKQSAAEYSENNFL